MSAAEESPILIPSEDEEEDGDEVQYIKEEKAPPITIDETEDQDQDDVIFVSTCPPPPPTLTTTWDDALSMDLDSFTLPPSPASSPTSTPTCSGDVLPMSRSSSLQGSFCPISALLDSSTAPSLPITSNPVAPVSADLTQAKISVPVLGSDLSLGAGSDLSITDSSAANLTALSGAGLSLASVTSDLASLSDSGDLTLPSVSGSLSGLGSCPSSGGLGDSKTLLTSDASRTVFSFDPTSNALDLRALHKKKRRSPFSSSLGALQDSSLEDSSSDDSDPADNASDPRNSDLGNSDDPDNSDEAEKSDDPENSDDDEANSIDLSEEEEDVGKARLPVLSGSVKTKSGVATTSVSPPTPLTSPPSSPSLSGWLDLALPPTTTTGPPINSGLSQPSASGPSATIQSKMTGTAKVTPPIPGPPVIDKCRDSHALGASPSSSSSSSGQSSFSAQVLACIPQLAVSTSGALSSGSLLAAHATPPSLGSSLLPTQSSAQVTSSHVSSHASSVGPLQAVSGQMNQSVSVSQQVVVNQSTSVSSSSSSTSLMSVPFCATALFDTRPQPGAANYPQQISSSRGGGGLWMQSSGRRHSLDFLDKLFDDCSSIISTMPPTSSSSIPSTSATPTSVGHGAPSSVADIKVVCSSVAVTSKPSGSAGTVPGGASSSSGSDKGSKRPSTTSISSLDAASLPPRKRVLKHSTSFTCPEPLSSVVAPAVCSVPALPVLPFSTSASSNPPASTSTPSVSCPLTTATARDLKPAASWLLTRCATQPRDAAAAGSSRLGQDMSGKDSGAMSCRELVVVCGNCGTKEGEKHGGEEECRLSQCSAGHSACGSCLLFQARRVLSGKQKVNPPAGTKIPEWPSVALQVKPVLPPTMEGVKWPGTLSVISAVPGGIHADIRCLTESLRCIFVGCGSFYPMKELKKSLPGLIVEILQERLDQDFVDFIDSISHKAAEDDAETKKAPAAKPSKSSSRKKAPQAAKLVHLHCLSDSSSSDADDEDEEEEDEEKSKSGKDDESYVDWMKGMDQAVDGGASSKPRGASTSEESRAHNDFPEHWTHMDNSKNLVEVVAVPLEPNSEEYINVAVRFHEHMLFPAADITRIVRIQNPYLWKSYSLKKEQMIQENGGRVVSEHQLFHGTKVSTIDAICRRGFDWRFCGKHGTAFGQGSYFAGDSLYSNAYTDRGTAPTSGSVILKSILQLPPSSSSDPSASVFPHDPSLSSMHVSQTSQPTSRLRVPQAGSGGAGPSNMGSSGTSMATKTGSAMKKLLPLLKSKMGGDKNAIIAHLLRSKSEKLRAITGGYGGPRPSSSGSRSALGSLMYSPSGSAPSSAAPAGNPMFGGRGGGPGPGPHHTPNGPPAPSTAHHPRSLPCRQQQGPASSSSQSSGPSQRQALYQRYSLLSRHPRPHPSASSAVPAFPPGQGLPTTQPSIHPTSVAPGNPPPPAGFRGPGKNTYPIPSKKYGSRPPVFGAGGVGKVSALMAPSSSSQSSSSQGGGGGMMVPVGGYPTNLSVSSTAVTLSGVGAPSLALLTANTNLQANSYLLVAPIPPNPASLPPLAPLPPHPHTLLSQPAPLSAPKAGMWSSSSSSSGSQALDLSKAVPCPRYMFLARVLTGIFTGGQNDYRRPPPLDPNDPLGRCYDSCVDNIHTPRIWVIFDSTQAYPEYAVEYQVNGDMYR